MPYRVQEEPPLKTLEGWSGEMGKQFSITFHSTNPMGFPDIAPYDGPLPDYLVAYNALSRVEPEEGVKGCYFYLHDNKFESVWTYPERAAHRLKTMCDVALGPDFSMYSDWPVAVQMHNKYRNHWCMALWQAEGIGVIPNVTWSDEASYEWCFDGFPQKAVLAVSSVGCNKNPEYTHWFLQGYREMIARLRPKVVVFYGPVPRAAKHGRAEVKEFKTGWYAYAKEGKVN